MEALTASGASPDNVYKVAKQVAGFLRVAMHELLLPHTKSLFPQNALSLVHSTQPVVCLCRMILIHVKVFQPPLPADLILELSVCNKKIVISGKSKQCLSFTAVYCLNITTLPPKVPTYNDSTTKTGQTYKW